MPHVLLRPVIPHIPGFEVRDSGFEIRVSDFGFPVSGSEFGEVGFRVPIPRSGGVYWGTSLIRNHLTLGPYRRPMPRFLGVSYGVERFLMGDLPLQGLGLGVEG